MLSTLVNGGTVQTAQILGQSGGWAVVVQYGKTQRTLTAKRGSARIFKRFETLASYLRDLGIMSFHVDATGYDAVGPSNQRARTDASARLKNAHRAAAYDEWLTTKVSTSLDGLSNGSNQQFSASEWEKIRAQKRSAL